MERLIFGANILEIMNKMTEQKTYTPRPKGAGQWDNYEIRPEIRGDSDFVLYRDFKGETYFQILSFSNIDKVIQMIVDKGGSIQRVYRGVDLSKIDKMSRKIHLIRYSPISIDDVILQSKQK